MVFDSADGFSTCTRRIRSNTPLQSLVTLNDPVYVEAAQALARRALVNASNLDDLKDEFNASASQPRLLVLLSPT